MINLNLSIFEQEIRDIVAQSNLPIYCVSSILKNILFEIDRLKEEEILRETIQNPPDISEDDLVFKKTFNYDEQKEELEEITNE